MSSRALSCGTKGLRRFRHSTQVALHCLRILLHVCVAIPTLGQVERGSFLPLSQLCCVELVCTQFAVAVAALVQTLLPCLFLSTSHTLRQLGTANIAFHCFCDIPVPSPHIEALGIKCLARQIFATDHTLHFCILLGGLRPTNVAFRVPSKITAASPRTQARRIKCFAR